MKKTGSGDGAAALIDGRCDIATMSRFMKPEEFKKAVDKDVLPVAHASRWTACASSVHPSNPVKALTSEQVRDIYAGKITNWKASRRLGRAHRRHQPGHVLRHVRDVR